MSLTRAKSNTQTGETTVTALDVAYILHMYIMFSGGIDYSTCLIFAGVDTLATRREYLTKRFFRRRVLPETLCLHYLLPEKK